MTNNSFELAGSRRTVEAIPEKKKKWYKGKPVSFCCGITAYCAWLSVRRNDPPTKDPTYMDLLNYNKAPDKEFLFGTDTMGRDTFSMIWYGGRISLMIGGLATKLDLHLYLQW